MSKIEYLDNLKYFVLKCDRCSLHKTKNNYVFGEGSLNSKIMFIGEAPGKNEDIYGKPFVGRAGKIFDDCLVSIGLDRNDIYISNILKCRPPKNRNPLKKEIKSCSEYIDKQIDIIKPNLIIPLGRISISYIFNKFKFPFQKINRIHGKIYSKNNLKIIPIYHPAAVIYNNKLKEILFEDFKIIEKFI
ncbi:MAG: DNA polymerase [Thermoplasmatales archaeon SG8-52-3]|nr:MAG: DNA polymerase [Thermoplasmatales archaeon SG8-52-3]